MKILFLEDRPYRQKKNLPNKEKDVEKLKSNPQIYMPESEELNIIITQINDESYHLEDFELQLIIVHKTILNTKGLAYLNKFCKEKKIKLVCFSGGTSQVVFNNDDYEFLILNSSDLYTNRLIPFLEKILRGQKNNLLELITTKWELSYMLLGRQILESINMEEDEDSKLRLVSKLEQIKKVVTIKSIEHLSKEITKKIIQN